MKSILKNIIVDNQERFGRDLVARSLSVPLESNKVLSIIGPRRSGKTSYMFQMIQRINREQKVHPSQILFLNLEDDRLFPTSLARIIHQEI